MWNIYDSFKFRGNNWFDDKSDDADIKRLENEATSGLTQLLDISGSDLTSSNSGHHFNLFFWGCRKKFAIRKYEDKIIF